MPIGARRTFRLGLVVALSLALGYGMELQFPFFAPVFGLLLTATPAPPPGLKGLLGLILVVTITLGVGLVVTPLLGKYPVSALLIIAAGIYLSTYISVGLGKAFLGTLLALGFALIPAVGLVSYGLAHRSDRRDADRHRRGDRQPVDRLSLLSRGPAQAERRQSLRQSMPERAAGSRCARC